MSDAQQIESDLRDYLDKEPNLSRVDRFKYLEAIFHKHLELNKLEHLITYKDLFVLFSEATTIMTKIRFPVRITGKELETKESVHIAIMEAFILYLNRMKLLKKLVKFDYKDIK
jgi:hypothetical protein